MAKSVVAFELTANGSQAEGSVKSLKAQLREAQQDVQKLSEKFGATSDEAVKAARKAAELKDAIGDAKALTDAFNPDAKFKAFGAALQGVAGGFAAVQGAQALFGSQSEELEKTLLKVQGAMALSQGLNALGEARDAFKTLGKQAVEAFNVIKGAIGASGIGLLVIALGTIYAYWDDIKEAVSGVNEEQKKVLETQKKSVTAAEKKLDAFSKTENSLRLQGKSEKEILNLKISQIKPVITALQAQLQSQKTMRQVQIDTAKRNKDILEGILKFLTVPINLLLKTVDSVGSALGKDFGLQEKFYGGIAKMVFDPEAVAQNSDKVIEETENKIADLLYQQEGYQLELQKIDQNAYNKSTATKEKNQKNDDAELKKKQDAEKARLDNLAAQNKHTDELIEQNRLSAMKDGFAKRQMELAGQEQKEIDAELERLNNKLITQEQYEINRSNILQKYANLQTQLIADEEQKRKDKDDADKKKKLEDEKAYNEALLQAEIELQEAKFGIVEGGISALQTLAQGNEKLSNILFAVEKAAAIAKIVVNTQNEIAGYYANPTWSLMPDGGLALKTAASLKAKIRAGISIGTILATTIAKYKNGGGGGNVPTPPNQIGMNAPLTPQVQTTNLNQGQINQLASATTRAFVLESDVSGSQERIRRINRAARIN